METGHHRNLLRNIESSRTKIEIAPGLIALDAELRDCLAAPATIDVEAEDVVEEVVPGGDLREDLLYVSALLGATGSGGTGGRAVDVSCQH